MVKEATNRTAWKILPDQYHRCHIQGIGLQKSPDLGVVVSRPIVVKARLRIIFSAGVSVGICEASGLGCDVSKGIVCVAGHGLSCRIGDLRDAS